MSAGAVAITQIPQVIEIAKQLASRPDTPLYETTWIDDSGTRHSIAITPRSLLMAGGASLLLSLAYLIYRFTVEEKSIWQSGGVGVFGIGAAIFGGLAGLPVETIQDLKEGGGAGAMLGNIVKYSGPLTLALDWAGVPVDETVEKKANWLGRTIKGWFT